MEDETKKESTKEIVKVEPTEVIKTETTEIKTEAPKVESRTMALIAKSPQELAGHQQAFIKACDENLAAAREELSDMEQNLAIAKKSKQTTKSWARMVTKAQKVIEYYEKVKAALEAGYFMIPDFPCDVFAVRTTKKKPAKKETKHDWTNRDVKSDNKAAGEGKFVSNEPEVGQFEEVDKAGEPDESALLTWAATEFQPVSFPVILVKPQIVEATAKAIKELVFDELGIMLPKTQTSRRTNRQLAATAAGDPVIIGRIRDPRGGQPATRNIAFVVAWWLDPRSI